MAEVLDAKYDPADNDRILVTCGRAAGQTAGLAVGGLLLVALAAGGGGSTPNTNGTN